MIITRKDFYRGLMATTVAVTSGYTGASHAQTIKSVGEAYEWRTIPYGAGGYITGFMYHPKEKGLLYTRTDVGGAYRFDPAHKRWIPLLDHVGRNEAYMMGVVSLALDPSHPERVYMVCGEYLGNWAPDGAILRSNDRGDTWQVTLLKVKVGGNADGRGAGERLQVDPNNGDILFYGSNQDGLFKSEDRGVSFSNIAFPTRAVTFVLFDPKSGRLGSPSQTLYVGSSAVVSGEGKGGLFKSSDGGKSFTPVEGTPDLIPQRAVFDGDGNLYVTFSDGLTPRGGGDGALMRRDAKSGKWKNISPMKPSGGGNPKFSYCGLDADSRSGTVVVATSNRWSVGDDIYLSRNGGDSWTALGDKSRHDPGKYHWLKRFMGGRDRMGHWIADVRIDPFNPESIIYGTGYGLWLTQNLSAADKGGVVEFAFEVENLEEIATTDMASPPAGATILAAFADLAGVAYDDLTQTPKTGLFTPVAVSNRSVDFAEKSPAFVVRTADDRDKGGYISTDGALTWKPFPTSPRIVLDAQNNYQNGGQIAISADATSMVLGLQRQGLFRTSNWGVTWTPTKGLPAGRQGLYPVADRALDGVYYVYDREGLTLYISTDSGVSFQPVIAGLPKVAGWQVAQLISTPHQPRDLWLATSLGLFHAAGAGAAMKQVKGVDEAWLISVGAAAKGKTYPAVYIWGKIKGVEGFFRSDDEGAAWVRINDDRHRFGSMRAMAADPLEYGTLYIAPHGRGLMAGRINGGRASES